jgi:hypothetical protein
MAYKDILHKVQSVIAARTSVSEAGITLQRMYEGYINELTDAKSPCMTFAASMGTGIKQAVIIDCVFAVGIYATKPGSIYAIIEDLIQYFADTYKAESARYVIYSITVEAPSTLVTYSPIAKANEGSLLLTVRYKNL